MPEVELDILSKVAPSMSEEDTVRLRDRVMEDVLQDTDSQLDIGNQDMRHVPGQR